VYDPFHITQEQWKQRANVMASFALFVERVDLFCSLLECGRVDHDKCEQFCAQWLEDEKVSYDRESDPGAPQVMEQFTKLRRSADLFENLVRLNGTPFDLDAKIRRHLNARGLTNEQIMLMSAAQICATLQTIDPIKPSAPSVLKTTSAFLETLVPPDYIIDGVVQRGFLYALCGKEGAGKTAILLLIAAHILLGRALGKKAAVRGRVLYLAGENPTEVKMRWQALCLELGIDESELDMTWVEGSKEKISKLLPKIHADCRSMSLEFTLVIVDTKQAFFEGKKGEDDNGDAVEDAQRHRQLTESLAWLENFSPGATKRWVGDSKRGWKRNVGPSHQAILVARIQGRSRKSPGSPRPPSKDRCTARSKQAGRRCWNWAKPKPGGGRYPTCHMHGACAAPYGKLA
jgi:hypothetical protein